MKFLNLLKRAPFVRLVIPLLLGTIVGLQFVFAKLYVLIAVVLISFFSLKVFARFLAYWSRGIFISIAWFSLGFLNAQLQRTDSFHLFEKNAVVIASVAEQINPKDEYLRFKVKILQINDSLVAKNDWNLMLTIKNDSLLSNLKYGNRLFLKANITELKNFGNPNEFDYKAYLQRKNVVAQSFIKKENLVVLHGFEGSYLKHWALNVRTYLLNQYIDNGITGQNLAVLSALSLGYKEDLSGETKATFSSTGAMHILAVSGLHVGIVYMILNKLLIFLRGRRARWIKFPILVAGIWIFAIISGASPSVLRASLMFSVLALGFSLNRESNIYNNILMSAFFLILFNPRIVLEVGFQLSYAAVISIVWLVPVIETWVKIDNKILKGIWTLAAVSIAAQLGTSPIALYYFHQFPNYFILTNILVVPLAGIILQLAIVFLSFSAIPFVGLILAKILDFAISFLLIGVRLIESFPYSSTQFIGFSFWKIFVFYALIISVFFFIIKKYYFLLRLSLVVSLFFVGISTVSKYYHRQQNQFIIYNSPNNSAYQILASGNNFAFHNLSDTLKWNYTAKMFNNAAMYANTSTLRFQHSDFNSAKLLSGLKRFGKERVFFIHTDSLENKYIAEPLLVDYLVLSDNASCSVEKLTQLFVFESLIIDSSVDYYKRKKWLDEATELDVSVYDVRSEGAFILNF